MRTAVNRRIGVGLINLRTGEITEIDQTDAKKRGIRFIKVWYAPDWERRAWSGRLRELQGASLRVLLHLLLSVGWNNEVPGTKEVAQEMELQQSHISRAYQELFKANLLQRQGEGYRLNPLFCWNGSEEQYEAAVRAPSQPQRQPTVPPAVAAGYREISQAEELD